MFVYIYVTRQSQTSARILSGSKASSAAVDLKQTDTQNKKRRLPFSSPPLHLPPSLPPSSTNERYKNLELFLHSWKIRSAARKTRRSLQTGRRRGDESRHTSVDSYHKNINHLVPLQVSRGDTEGWVGLLLLLLLLLHNLKHHRRVCVSAFIDKLLKRECE